jgi:uncharacterized cupin superfamily protein
VEARIEQTPHGTRPTGEGWYVLNVREAAWKESDAFGRWLNLEGDVRWPQLAMNVHVLEPGKPACMYHGENIQEAFLVLAGECILIVEGRERRLRQHDFVHCPAWVDHVFVGAEAPCAVLMIGARPDDEVNYPVDPVAARHGASVPVATPDPTVAYAPFAAPTDSRYRTGDLGESASPSVIA